MNPLTLEWIAKAEGDYATARRELRARKAPNYDAACFHAQQLAEKYLKACLQEAGKPVPKIHNLIELLAMLAELDRSFLLLRPDLTLLDRYAVRYRYPGDAADRQEAQQALRAAQAVRRFARGRLGLT